MNYYEITFTYESSIEKEIINDILAGELAELGFESFTHTEEGLCAYIAEKKYRPEEMVKKTEDFPIEPVRFSYAEKFIEGKNWNEEWEKNYFKPITIGKQCIIHASFFHPEESYTYDIIIDPKMAFGTGNHETTRLMIKEILPLELVDKNVLDMGCGTAVLAILAAMKGARKVTAIDIDEWAYNNALENSQINGTPEIEVMCGGVEVIPADKTYELIFANINRNILLEDIPHYSKHLITGGTLLISGFYKEDIPAIEKVCLENSLEIQSHEVLNNWTVVHIVKI